MTSSSTITSELNKNLPKGMILLTGEGNWDSWDFKFLACASRDEIDYVLAEDDPNEDATRTMVPLTESELVNAKNLQVATAQLEWDAFYQQHHPGHQVPQVDPAVLPDISDQTRPETNAERQKRCKKYRDDVSKLWSLIVASVAEGPLAIVRQAASKDGKGAHDKLRARYEAMSSSTCVSLIKRCFDFIQDGAIADHVTDWLDLMRKLKAAELDFNPTMECVMFLRTLKPIFKTFKDNMFMKIKLVPSDLYREVIDFNEACLGESDEANTRGVALNATSGMPQCFAGVGCTRPGCRFVHPPGFTPAKSHANAKCPKFGATCKYFLSQGYCRHKAGGKGGGKGGDHRRNGGGGKGGNSEPYKRKFETKNKAMQSLEKKHKSQSDKLAAVRKAIVDDGADPKEFGFVAVCRSPADSLRCLQCTEDGKRRKVAFTFDTGANRHFTKGDIPLSNAVDDGSLVGIADGTDVKIEKKGTLSGVFAGTDSAFEVEAKKSTGFAANLFSGLQAVRDGYRIVLSDQQSFMERGNDRVPLRKTDSGWSVDLEIDGDHALVGAVNEE